MNFSARTFRFLEFIVVLAVLMASSLWCISAARSMGPTFDEPVYLQTGLEYWRTGSHSTLMRMGTMPLPVDIQTLALHVWERWRGVLFDPIADMTLILPIARAGNLVFWWLLVIYGWATARRIAGRWGGMLAAAMLACEPVLLGHACLATTDIAVSACLMALLYHFRSGREGGWRTRVGVPSLWFGACVLSKVSGLGFGPLCMLAAEIERVTPANALAEFVRSEKKATWLKGWLARLRPFWSDLKWIVMLGLAIVFVYTGSDWRPEPSFVKWAKTLPQGTVTQTTMLWFAEHMRLFSNAGEAFVRQIKHNMRGQGPQGTYLLGMVGRAFWYYYPVALTIKLSTALLIVGATLTFVSRGTLRNWAIAAAIALLLLSLVSRLQIGIRLILPLVGLVIAGIAAALVNGWRESECGWRKNILLGEAAVALLWTAAAACAVWPQGICYTSAFWGGTPNGYLYLSDSNYDWGQGLDELASWRKQRGLERIAVWYFGTDPAIRSAQFESLPLQEMATAEEIGGRVDGRYLAASTTMLYGAIRTPSQRVAMSFLRSRRPIGRTTDFLIFDFTRNKDRHLPAAEPSQVHDGEGQSNG